MHDNNNGEEQVLRLLRHFDYMVMKKVSLQPCSSLKEASAI